MSLDLSTCIGSQTPRLANYPTYFTTLGDDAIDLAAVAGIDLLPWQETLIRASMGQKAGGTGDARADRERWGQWKWSSTSSGLIVPRQQGKNVVVYVRKLAGIHLLRERIMYCLDVDTPILTGDGHWKPMADITTDDYVFHPSGRPIKVVGKSPVWLNRECFRVTTTDGRSVVADADHLWTVTDRHEMRCVGPRGGQDKQFVEKTLTTRELLESGIERYPNRELKGFRYTLPRQHEVQLPVRNDLPVDPYVLGAWLGDGNSYNATLTSQVSDIAYWREEFANLGVPTTQHRRVTNIGILGGTWRGLSALGLVGDKHVPESYLLASSEQRLALLQGLMDTDGTSSGGRASFTGTNKRLADAVLFLARSFGWRAGVDVCDPDKRSPGGFASTQVQYRVKWTPKPTDSRVPFRMPRKVANIAAASTGIEGRADGRFTVSIASIVPVPSVPVACINVDSPDGLFLAGKGLLSTHNSAHEFDTARDAHRELSAFIAFNEDLEDEFILPHKIGAAELSIRHSNGGFIHYVARGANARRGRTRIDLMILDEAFALDNNMMGSLSPLQQASLNPQTWYTSSAGTEDSPVLTRIRDVGTALAEQDSADHSTLLFAEWSCPEGSDPHDFDNWIKANPSLGVLGIAPVERLREDYETKMDIQQFAREHLGMWDDPAMNAVIPFEAWKNCNVDDGPAQGAQRVIAIDVSPDRSWASISVAEKWPDSRHHVEVIESHAGTHWILGKAALLLASSNPPRACVVQGGAQAGSLSPELEQLGYKVHILGPADIGQATAQFYDDITADVPKCTHLDDKGLLTGLGGAAKYKIGPEQLGHWGWLRKGTSIDITGIVGCSYANRVLTLESVEETLTAKKPHRLFFNESKYSN